jgi:co-chaperonin GroES (HSP10)
MIEAIIHRVIIKPDTLEDSDPLYKAAKNSGIYIPEMEESKRERAGVDRGVVVQVGPTAFRDFGALEAIKVGDYVAYARYAGKWIKDFDGTEYLAINDEDVICKLIKETENV